MQILDELAARGLLADVTDRAGLADLFAKETVTAYVGFDPTASSLHVGSLVAVMLLKRIQIAGHRPIIVVGGATGMIGDPSGKSDERNLLDDATIQANVAGIPHGAKLVAHGDRAFERARALAARVSRSPRIRS